MFFSGLFGHHVSPTIATTTLPVSVVQQAAVVASVNASTTSETEYAQLKKKGYSYEKRYYIGTSSSLKPTKTSSRYQLLFISPYKKVIVVASSTQALILPESTKENYIKSKELNHKGYAINTTDAYLSNFTMPVNPVNKDEFFFTTVQHLGSTVIVKIFSYNTKTNLTKKIFEQTSNNVIEVPSDKIGDFKLKYFPVPKTLGIVGDKLVFAMVFSLGDSPATSCMNKSPDYNDFKKYGSRYVEITHPEKGLQDYNFSSSTLELSGIDSEKCLDSGEGRKDSDLFFTFQPKLSIKWSRDNNTVYYLGMKVKGVDASTFKEIDEEHGMDATHVFDGFGNIFTDIADMSTLEDVNGFWLKDKVNVYTGNGQILEHADPATFVDLGMGYGRDKDNLYCSPNSPAVSKDSRELPGTGKGVIVVGADPDSFEVIPGKYSFYGKDSSHVYSNCKELKGADVTTFVQVSDGYYYKDKTSVWYEDTNSGDLISIPGADSASFQLISKPDVAKDKSHTYGFGAKGDFYVK